MKIEPKFYKNWEDNNHCLQASVMMVINTLNGEITWDEVNKITEYKDGLYSWSCKAATALSNRIPGTIFISELDYEDFAKNGESYLKKYWERNPEWFDKQKEMASSGFQREQNFAKDLMEEKIFENKNVDKEEIEKLLDRNLIIALVDSHKLAGKLRAAGHFVVVYGKDNNNFILHDPGFPPRPSWSVNKKLFEQAFQKELIVIPKGEFKFGLEMGRNDPCLCGSGKKYKKCHGK